MTKSKKSGPASSFQMIIKIINKVYRFSFHSDYLSLWRRVLLFQLNAKFYYGVSKTQISSPLPWKQYAASLTELRHFCKNRSRDPVIRIFRNDLAALVKGERALMMELQDTRSLAGEAILTMQKLYQCRSA